MQHTIIITLAASDIIIQTEAIALTEPIISTTEEALADMSTITDMV